MRLHYVIIPALALLLAGGLNSCSKSSTPAPNPPPPDPTVSFQVTTDSKFGSVITTGGGYTLYFFAPDASGNSACTGLCLGLWPAVYVASPVLGTGLAASDFGEITRSDGAKQSTYKGWPLYTYSGDAGTGGVYGTPTTGAINGDGVGGIWFVAKPDYTVMLAKAQLVGEDAVLYDSLYKPGTGSTLYMTNDRGVTLYSFSIDKANTNNYTKSDFSNDPFWPIVQISTVQNVPSVLNKADFGTITVFTKPQMTYKGWPVYTFGPDSLIRGNNKGISVPEPGIWPVMDQFSAAAPQ